MKNYKLLFFIVILFNYCLVNILANNNYYLISILRNENDKNFDKESKQVQKEIIKLVNDRMNDVYDIILDNKDSYVDENGNIDEKLNELTETSQLRKQNGSEKTKFLFINSNSFNQNRSFNETVIMEEERIKGNDKVKYIPIDSDLVSPLCPVLNYFVIRVYLSDVTLKKIENIPNVIYYEIRSLDDSLEYKYTIQDSSFYEKSTKETIPEQIQKSSEKFYNTKEILDETHWRGVEIQELQYFFESSEITFNPLSVVSQGFYVPGDDILYDNNYYYPSSAGKGVDIYIADTGLHTSILPREFDNYKDTPDERTISCEGNIYDGKFHWVNDTEKYDCSMHNLPKEYEKEYYNHGTVAAIVAAGTISGAAKKANIHALALDIMSDSVLVSMDYIKNNGNPHKTVVNFSFGLLPHSKIIQDKLNEMVEDGFIFIIAAGNRGINVCKMTEDFPIYDGYISVGAVNVNDDYYLEVKKEPFNIKMSKYSDYGECIDIFAPGLFTFKNLDNGEMIYERGTSFSSPMVVGVAATLISEHPEIKYDYNRMKQTLIDLSLKDVILNLKDNTPNRLLNNGKKLTYQHPRCDHPSGKYSCGDNRCCSIHGICIDPETRDLSLKSLCYLENNCQSEFGFCFTGNYNNEKSVNECLNNECCTTKLITNTINNPDLPTEGIFTDLEENDISLELTTSFIEVDSDSELEE